MNGLSPTTRKIVAVGLLVLGLLLVIQMIVAPLFQALIDGRDELEGLRARRARLTAIEGRLLPDASTMPAGLALGAPTRAAAEARFRALIVGSATIAGVQVSLSTAPSPGSSTPPDPQLRLAVTASAPEGALIAFAGLVEHGMPLIRFEQWRIEAGGPPDRKLTLNAVAIAAWAR